MKFKNNKRFGIALASILFAFILQFLVLPVATVAKTAYAATSTTVTITNGNFNTNSTSFYLESNPSGWSKVYSTSATTAGIINTKTPNFTSYQDTYRLTTNPQTMFIDTTDTKVLMINARNSNSDNGSYYQGFDSNSISLSAYSYYSFSILVKTEVGAMASVYLNNLEDENLDSSLTQFELIQTSLWKEYKFYVETGAEQQSVNIGLWLGSKSTVKSPFAVFFDNITVNKLTEKRFAEESQNNAVTKTIELEKQYITSVDNSNFETINPLGWTSIDAFPVNSIHQVINTTQAEVMTTQGYTYLGGDNSEGTKALWLASKGTHSEFGYKSSDITIDRFAIYKINVNVKVDSDTVVRVALVENNNINDFYETAGIEETYYSYEPSSIEFKISSNSTNTLLNNYNTYSFYVKGHPLFDTTAHLELVLAKVTDDDTQVSGSALFDNVTIEKISNATYNSASDSATVKKLELTTVTGTPAVANGTFNLAQTVKSGDIFPVSPSNWNSAVEDEVANVYGIINTNTTHYNNNIANYGNITNPGNPIGFVQDTDIESNNVLMMWNKTSSYQSVTSDSLSLKEDSHYTVTFEYKLPQPGLNFNVKLVDKDGNKLFEQNFVGSSSNQAWTTYTAIVKTGSIASEVKLVLSLGTQSNPAVGFAFIDNVNYTTTTLTEDAFATKVALQNGNNKVVDLSNMLFSTRLAQKEEVGVYELSAFTGNLDAGTQNPNSDAIAEAGVLDGTANEYGILASENNENAVKNIFFIRNNATASYSITSIQKTNLKDATIYKFSVYLRTRLQNPGETYDVDYGATFNLVGTNESITNINTNDEWKEYIIIVNTTTSTDVQLKFGLTSQTETTGLLFVDNITLTTLTTDEYQTYVTTFEDKDADNDHLLIIGSTDIEEEDNEEPTEETAPSFNWLILPSAITAIALILAVAGSVLRQVNFKKYIKRRTSEYDRKKTLYRDTVRKQAEEKRDAEIKELNEQIKAIDEKLEVLEAENKERLANNRREKGKTIDKTIEKEFKLYASKHTRLENQKEALVERVKNANSAEYLLSLQKKITAENLKKELSKPKTK